MRSWSWVKFVHFSKALTPFISLRHIVLFTFFPVIVSYQVVCLFRDISLNARDASLHFLTPCQDVFAKMSADWQFQTDPPTNFKFWNARQKRHVFGGKPFRQTFRSWFQEKSIFVQPWQFIITTQFNSHPPLTYSYSKKCKDASWWGQQDHLRWMEHWWSDETII